ncbi:unnamed protein product [Amoebophrya sp. A120]|nr:unnamed protein product [Amoebophrya sp. A120]|eukprot:GSA120T00019435001.1
MLAPAVVLFVSCVSVQVCSAPPGTKARACASQSSTEDVEEIDAGEKSNGPQSPASQLQLPAAAGTTAPPKEAEALHEEDFQPAEESSWAWLWPPRWNLFSGWSQKSSCGQQAKTSFDEAFVQQSSAATSDSARTPTSLGQEQDTVVCSSILQQLSPAASGSTRGVVSFTTSPRGTGSPTCQDFVSSSTAAAILGVNQNSPYPACVRVVSKFLNIKNSEPTSRVKQQALTAALNSKRLESGSGSARSHTADEAVLSAGRRAASQHQQPCLSQAERICRELKKDVNVGKEMQLVAHQECTRTRADDDSPPSVPASPQATQAADSVACQENYADRNEKEQKHERAGSSWKMRDVFNRNFRLVSFANALGGRKQATTFPLTTTALPTSRLQVGRNRAAALPVPKDQLHATLNRFGWGHLAEDLKFLSDQDLYMLRTLAYTGNGRKRTRSSTASSSTKENQKAGTKEDDLLPEEDAYGIEALNQFQSASSSSSKQKSRELQEFKFKALKQKLAGSTTSAADEGTSTTLTGASTTTLPARDSFILRNILMADYFFGGYNANQFNFDQKQSVARDLRTSLFEAGVFSDSQVGDLVQTLKRRAENYKTDSTSNSCDAGAFPASASSAQELLLQTKENYCGGSGSSCCVDKDLRAGSVLRLAPCEPDGDDQEDHHGGAGTDELKASKQTSAGSSVGGQELLHLPDKNNKLTSRKSLGSDRSKSTTLSTSAPKLTNAVSRVFQSMQKNLKQQLKNSRSNLSLFSGLTSSSRRKRKCKKDNLENDPEFFPRKFLPKFVFLTDVDDTFWCSNKEASGIAGTDESMSPVAAFVQPSGGGSGDYQGGSSSRRNSNGSGTGTGSCEQNKPAKKHETYPGVGLLMAFLNVQSSILGEGEDSSSGRKEKFFYVGRTKVVVPAGGQELLFPHEDKKAGKRTSRISAGSRSALTVPSAPPPRFLLKLDTEEYKLENSLPFYPGLLTARPGELMGTIKLQAGSKFGFNKICDRDLPPANSFFDPGLLGETAVGAGSLVSADPPGDQPQIPAAHQLPSLPSSPKKPITILPGATTVRQLLGNAKALYSYANDNAVTKPDINRVSSIGERKVETLEQYLQIFPEFVNRVVFIGDDGQADMAVAKAMLDKARVVAIKRVWQKILVGKRNSGAASTTAAGTRRKTFGKTLTLPEGAVKAAVGKTGSAGSSTNSDMNSKTPANNDFYAGAAAAGAASGGGTTAVANRFSSSNGASATPGGTTTRRNTAEKNSFQELPSKFFGRYFEQEPHSVAMEMNRNTLRAEAARDGATILREEEGLAEGESSDEKSRDLVKKSHQKVKFFYFDHYAPVHESDPARERYDADLELPVWDTANPFSEIIEFADGAFYLMEQTTTDDEGSTPADDRDDNYTDEEMLRSTSAPRLRNKSMTRVSNRLPTLIAQLLIAGVIPETGRDRYVRLDDYFCGPTGASGRSASTSGAQLLLGKMNSYCTALFHSAARDKNDEDEDHNEQSGRPGSSTDGGRGESSSASAFFPPTPPPEIRYWDLVAPNVRPGRDENKGEELRFRYTVKEIEVGARWVVLHPAVPLGFTTDPVASDERQPQQPAAVLENRKQDEKKDTQIIIPQEHHQAPQPRFSFTGGDVSHKTDEFVTALQGDEGQRDSIRAITSAEDEDHEHDRSTDSITPRTQERLDAAVAESMFLTAKSSRAGGDARNAFRNVERGPSRDEEVELTTKRLRKSGEHEREPELLLETIMPPSSNDLAAPLAGKSDQQQNQQLLLPAVIPRSRLGNRPRTDGGLVAGIINDASATASPQSFSLFSPLPPTVPNPRGTLRRQKLQQKRSMWREAIEREKSRKA